MSPPEVSVRSKLLLAIVVFAATAALVGVVLAPLALLTAAAPALPPAHAQPRAAASSSRPSVALASDQSTEAPFESEPEPSLDDSLPLTPELAHLLWLKESRLPPPRPLLRQGVVHLPRTGRSVVLTFDDGPSANTPAILAILRRYHAKATFFFVGGRAERKTAVLRAVLAQGSEIGNHTYDHVSLLGRTKAADEDEIRRAEAVYYREVGVRPVWVRPQSGWVDQIGLDAIAALGKRYVFWDDFGSDTVKRLTPADIESRVLERARPGSIILLHETSKRSVAALPGILAHLEERGLVVTSLTDATRALPEAVARRL